MRASIAGSISRLYLVRARDSPVLGAANLFSWGIRPEASKEDSLWSDDPSVERRTDQADRETSRPRDKQTERPVKSPTTEFANGSWQ